jgi:hypothetical protein
MSNTEHLAGWRPIPNEELLKLEVGVDRGFAVAEHEAAHAVMAFATGLEVNSVAIDLDPKTVLVSLQSARRGALFCLAGVVYENFLAGLYEGGTDMPPSREDDGDLADAYGFADMLDGGQATNRTMVWLLRKTLDILDRNKEPLQALIAKLNDVHSMTGAAAKDVWLAHGGRLEADIA